MSAASLASVAHTDRWAPRLQGKAYRPSLPQALFLCRKTQGKMSTWFGVRGGRGTTMEKISVQATLTPDPAVDERNASVFVWYILSI